MGLEIKKICKEQPKLPIRDYPAEIATAVGPRTHIPSKTTISDFLLKNHLQVIKLLKKPFAIPKNVLKRVTYAMNNLNNKALAETTIWSDETTVRMIPKAKQSPTVVIQPPTKKISRITIKFRWVDFRDVLGLL